MVFLFIFLSFIFLGGRDVVKGDREERVLLTGDATTIHLQQQNLGIYKPVSKKQDPAVQLLECINYVNI